MSYAYPTPDDNGKTIHQFSQNGWALDADGSISAERLASAAAMGIKLDGLSNTHRVACAIIYNNRCYFGRSHHGLTVLPQALQDAMRHRSATSHSVGNCAEIQAMDAVVRAGYDPEQRGQGLKAHAIDTRTGETKPVCSNCTMLLVGAEGT